MIVLQRFISIAAVISSFAGASPLQFGHLEQRVPFCESRNPLLLTIRASPQASAFCSAFLNIQAPYTTTTLTRTIRTVTTRPVGITTTSTTETSVARPPDATVSTEQLVITTESPSATETTTITEPLVEVQTSAIVETRTDYETSTLFETLTKTESLFFTETSTSSEFVTTITITQTVDGTSFGRRATSAAVALDKRLLAPSVILTARSIISSACSCVIKPPITRTITRLAWATSTSVRPPTSTKVVRTITTTFLPQASITSTVFTTSTSTADVVYSTTSTTLTVPTQTLTSSTSTSGLVITELTTQTTETTSSTSSTTTTTTTAFAEATETISVQYLDRCNVRGETPDISASFLNTNGVTAAACGNECRQARRCQSWTWQSSNGECQLFGVNLFQVGFVPSEQGALAGYDVNCEVPATVRPNPSCAVRGYGTVPPPLVEPFVVSGLFKGCSDACYENANCRSWSLDTATSKCSLYGAKVASYLVDDGFLSASYSDRSCIPPPDVCERVGETSVAGVPKFNGQTGFSSAATCAAGCKADATCVSYSYQGLLIYTGRSCIFYSVKAALLDIRPTSCPSCSPIRFSDSGCALPPTLDVPCGAAVISIRQLDTVIPSISLQQCSQECSQRATCQTFVYQPTFDRGCLLFNQPIDAVVALAEGSAVKAYSKGCPTPPSTLQVCSSLGFTPTPPTASLAILTSVSSFSDCAVQCQNHPACLSSWYRAEPKTCTLLADTSVNSGYTANAFTATTRWHDKSCGLPPTSLCNARANSMPANGFRNERAVSVGQDSLANCDDTCRRDSQCKSSVFASFGATTTCRTFSANARELQPSINPTGPFYINDKLDCGKPSSDVASLSPICGPPSGSRPFVTVFRSFTFNADAAAGLLLCQTRCQEFNECQSYAGVLQSGNTYLCYLWTEPPVVALLTTGVSINNALRFPTFFDRECVLPPAEP